jgi:uncharacterized protein YceK
MRKIISAGVAVVLAATLAGCASTRNDYSPTEETVKTPNGLVILEKTLDDGAILECAWVTETDGRSGFDCNWEGVTAERARLYE